MTNLKKAKEEILEEIKNEEPNKVVVDIDDAFLEYTPVCKYWKHETLLKAIDLSLQKGIQLGREEMLEKIDKMCDRVPTDDGNVLEMWENDFRELKSRIQKRGGEKQTEKPKG